VAQSDVAEHAAQDSAELAEGQFDQAAQSGWNFFTKFLLGNVVFIVIALLVIGVFTVWW
jgi:hypothetical protein